MHRIAQRARGRFPGVSLISVKQIYEMCRGVRNKLRAEKLEDGLRDRVNDQGWLNQKTLFETVYLFNNETSQAGRMPQHPKSVSTSFIAQNFGPKPVQDSIRRESRDESGMVAFAYQHLTRQGQEWGCQKDSRSLVPVMRLPRNAVNLCRATQSMAEDRAVNAYTFYF